MYKPADTNVSQGHTAFILRVLHHYWQEDQHRQEKAGPYVNIKATLQPTSEILNCAQKNTQLKWRRSNFICPCRGDVLAELTFQVFHIKLLTNTQFSLRK